MTERIQVEDSTFTGNVFNMILLTSQRSTFTCSSSITLNHSKRVKVLIYYSDYFNLYLRLGKISNYVLVFLIVICKCRSKRLGKQLHRS